MPCFFFFLQLIVINKNKIIDNFPPFMRLETYLRRVLNLNNIYTVI